MIPDSEQRETPMSTDECIAGLLDENARLKEELAEAVQRGDGHDREIDQLDARISELERARGEWHDRWSDAVTQASEAMRLRDLAESRVTELEAKLAEKGND
jgi:chromosome segregation ATPase